MGGGYNAATDIYIGDPAMWLPMDSLPASPTTSSEFRLVCNAEDKVCVTGGTGYGEWCTSDWGSTWTPGRFVGSVALKRVGHEAVMITHAGDMEWLLLGGHDGTGFRNDVWRYHQSSDTYVCVCHSAPWTGRQRFSVQYASATALVLMGGNNGGFFSDVWSSPDDGVTWNQLTNAAPWGQRSSTTSFAIMGTLHLLAGTGGGNPYNNDHWQR
jgi:hypothetical protein